MSPNQPSNQPPIQPAYAQLIAALQAVGTHPDCSAKIAGPLEAFELELHNHLLDLAEENTRLPQMGKRAEVLSVLLRQAFA